MHNIYVYTYVTHIFQLSRILYIPTHICTYIFSLGNITRSSIYVNCVRTLHYLLRVYLCTRDIRVYGAEWREKRETNDGERRVGGDEFV